MALPESFGLDLPSEPEAIGALGDTIGHDMAAGLWDLCARSLGLTRPITAPDDLRRMAERIMQIGELARVSGRSLKIRVITYDALARPVAGV
jgi:hypothetical protein